MIANRSWLPVRFNRHGVFFRLLLAFGFFALAMSLAMGAAAYISARSLNLDLLARRANLLLEAILKAEEHTRRGQEKPLDSNELIESLNLKFLAGKEVGERLAQFPAGLHIINSGDEYVYIKHIDGVPYVITGAIAVKSVILKDIAAMLFVCALAGLSVAAALALVFSRYLARPASMLASAIKGERRGSPAPIPEALLARKDEIGVLAGTLSQYQTRMAAILEREKSFSSAASHELRTPLTVISQGLEILEAQNDVDGKSRAIIGRLMATAEHMSRVITDLLALARGDSIQREAIEPVWALLSAAEILYPEAGLEAGEYAKHGEFVLPLKGGGHLRISGNAGMVSGNGELAISVFRNLLENAIRHGGDSDIHIIFGPGCVRFCNKGEFGDGNQGSSGFGLQIAGRACARLGWELCREDSPGETRFIVKFPVWIEANPAHPA